VAKEPQPELTIEENLYAGEVLKLSDGTIWQVAPDDQTISQIWLFSFPVKVEPSGDASYPYTIENENSKTKLLVRPLSEKELNTIEKNHHPAAKHPSYPYKPTAPPTPQPLTP